MGAGRVGAVKVKDGEKQKPCPLCGHGPAVFRSPAATVCSNSKCPLSPLRYGLAPEAWAALSDMAQLLAGETMVNGKPVRGG